MILVFFSFHSFALTLENKTAKLPKGMLMVSQDKTHEKGDYYVYTLKHKKFLPPKTIEIKKYKKRKTVEQLLSTLFYSYIKEDKELLKTLFDKKTLESFLKISDAKYQEQLDFLKLITAPVLNYAFEYRGGIVLSWKDPLFKQARQVFVRIEKGQYRIGQFHADKSDHYFWNVNLYMAGAPFKTYKAKMLQSFKNIKNGQKKRLSFQLKHPGNYLHLFRKDNFKMSLSLRDNYEQNSAPIQDANSEVGYIDVVLQGENFTQQGKNILYFLESSYPMKEIPKNILENAVEFTIHKE